MAIFYYIVLLFQYLFLIVVRLFKGIFSILFNRKCRKLLAPITFVLISFLLYCVLVAFTEDITLLQFQNIAAVLIFSFFFFLIVYWTKDTLLSEHNWFLIFNTALLILTILFLFLTFFQSNRVLYMEVEKSPLLCKYGKQAEDIYLDGNYFFFTRTLFYLVPCMFYGAHMILSFFSDCWAVSRFLFKTVHLYLSDIIFIIYFLGIAMIILAKITDMIIRLVSSRNDSSGNYAEIEEL